MAKSPKARTKQAKSPRKIEDRQTTGPRSPGRKKGTSGSNQKALKRAEGMKFVDGRVYKADSSDYNIKKAERSLGIKSSNNVSMESSAENVLSILGVTIEEGDRDYSFLQEISDEKIADKIAWEETKNENISITDKFPDESDNIFTPDKSPPQVISRKRLAGKAPVSSKQIAADFVKYTKRLPQID